MKKHELNNIILLLIHVFYTYSPLINSPVDELCTMLKPFTAQYVWLGYE